MSSPELRERIVQAYGKREGSMRELAKRFCVSFDTVFRSVQRVRKLGEWVSGKLGGHRPRQVSQEGEAAVRQWFREQPDRTLAQVCRLYHERFGVEVSVWTMSRTLKRMGWTRKERSCMPRNSNAKTSKSDAKSFASSVRKSGRRT